MATVEIGEWTGGRCGSDSIQPGSNFIQPAMAEVTLDGTFWGFLVEPQSSTYHLEKGVQADRIIYLSSRRRRTAEREAKHLLGAQDGS